ncbi:immunoglobulin alpha-2 heavy chain-like [Mixophyes fleayi]|uniref:immunoglobulin alpha-2 heavy chain-like n=1 Tax=Mixophyes fleayi TaxID=3061075 RepID=UPI003F4E3999
MYKLLLKALITAQLFLYRPQNVMFDDIKVSAVISCVSNDPFNAETGISWYQKIWRGGESTVCANSCILGNDTHKGTCGTGKHKARLEVNNLETNDFGVFYCTFHYVSVHLFGNGTTVIVGDHSTYRSLMHLIDPPQTQLTTNSPVQLACMVREARHTVHIAWSISGTPHKGRMISMKEPGGTSTFLNLISFPRDTMDHGKHVTCEIWFNSSHIRVQWEVPEEDAGPGVPLTRHRVYLKSVQMFVLIFLLYYCWSHMNA